MRKFLLLFFSAISAFIFLVTTFLEEPLFKDENTIQDYSYTPLIKNSTHLDTISLSYHYQNIQNHFQKPLFQEVPEAFIYREDEKIEAYYSKLTFDGEQEAKDIGNYGTALLKIESGLYDLAEKYLNDISEKEQPYIHAAIGNANYRQGYFKNALSEYYQELKYKEKGNYKDAYTGIIHIYRYRKNFDSLYILLKNPLAAPLFPEYIKADTYFVKADVIPYLKHNFQIYGTTVGIISAFFISLIWFFYFTQFKIFLKKQWVLWSIIFFIGTFTPYISLIFYDIYKLILNFNTSGGIINDFLYCIFGIGLIEEFSKITPLLLILLFGKKKLVKEPIDLVIIATLTALGFAFSENLMYFEKYYGEESTSVIHTRGMVSVIMHIFCSSLVAYGFALFSYKKGRNIALYIPVTFFLAIFSHGFFDFWLINDSVAAFYLFSTFMLVFSLLLLNTIISNCLNNSPYYKSGIDIHSDKMKIYIISALSSILMLEYMANALYYGAYYANDILIDNLFSFCILLAFFASNFSNFNLVKNYWAPINFNLFIQKNKLAYLINEKITFQPNDKSKHFSIYPLTGKVLNMEAFSNNPEYYLIELDHMLQVGTIETNKLLVKINPYKVKNGALNASLYIPKEEEILNQHEKEKEELILIDFAFLLHQGNISLSEKVLPWNTGWKIAGLAGLLFISFTVYTYMNYTTSRLAYRRALKLIENKDFYSSEQYVRSALYYDKNYSDAYLLLGKIHMMLNGFDQFTLEVLTESIENSGGENPVMFYLRGKCYYNMKNTFESLADFNHAITLSNFPDSTYYYLGEINYQLKQYDPAITNYDAFISKKKEAASEVAYLHKALCLYEFKKYDLSTQVLNQVLNKNSRSGIAYYYRGLCELAENKKGEACTDFSNAVSNGYDKGYEMMNEYCSIQTTEEVNIDNTYTY